MLEVDCLICGESMEEDEEECYCGFYDDGQVHLTSINLCE